MFLVPLLGVFAGVRRLFFVQRLEGVAQFGPSAEQVKCISQLLLGVGEFSIVLVVPCEACKVDTRAERVPHILVELVRFLASQLIAGQLVGGNDEDRIFIAVLEVLVEARSDLGAVSFEQQLGDVDVVRLESVFDAEFCASDELSFDVGLVRVLHRHVLASPVDFV